MAPFSYESRKEIGKRDGWTCECGRSFKDGWMVHASHLDHERNEMYDQPEVGKIECVKCHIARHIEIHLEVDDLWSFNSLRLLTSLAVARGMRKTGCNNEDTLAEDIEDLEMLFNGYDLDLEAFV